VSASLSESSTSPRGTDVSISAASAVKPGGIVDDGLVEPPGAVDAGAVLAGAVSEDDDPPGAPFAAELPDEHPAPRTRIASPNEETRSPRFDTDPSSQLVAPDSCDPTQPTGWHARDAPREGRAGNVAWVLRVPSTP
jgi:hypothetical protein